MANSCPTIGLCLGIISTVGILFALASKEWKKNSPVASQNVNVGIYSYEGLWVRCTSPIPGTFQCDTYDTSFISLPAQLQGMRAMMCLATMLGVFSCVATIFGLPCIANIEERQKVMACRAAGLMALVAADLTAQRAMMCIAAICSVAGLIAGALGLHCIAVMEDGSTGKIWSGRCGGILMLLAGVLTMASVSWYAANVVQEYYKQLAAGASFLYEFGVGLYIGWISSGLAIISGILLACCTCGNDDEGEEYRYAYKPPTNKPSGPSRNAEYV